MSVYLIRPGSHKDLKWCGDRWKLEGTTRSWPSLRAARVAIKGLYGVVEVEVVIHLAGEIKLMPIEGRMAY